jgi:hypothetical protein
MNEVLGLPHSRLFASIRGLNVWIRLCQSYGVIALGRKKGVRGNGRL